MSNVPTSTPADLSACGEPATTRIEVYTPRDGLAHGSLDGVMYLCDRHADEFLEVAGWDTGDITPHRTALTDRDILCGNGWDFVAGKAIEAPSATLDPASVSPETNAEAADVLGVDHPIVNTAVEALRAFGDDLSREDAARLLPMWQHDKELSDRERSAVLAQFPEDAEGTDQKGMTLESTPALGSSQVQVEDEIVEALCRIDEKLKAAKEDGEAAYSAGHEDGYAAGYTDGLSRALDPDSVPETPATRAAEKKEARGLRATLIVFQLGWKIGRGVRKTDYQRAVNLAVRILEERQAAKGAGE